MTKPARPGDLRRTVSEALRAVRSREEQETLLGEHEEADGEGCIGLSDHVHFTPNPHSKLPVYKTIHRYVETLSLGLPSQRCVPLTDVISSIRRLILATIGIPP